MKKGWQKKTLGALCVLTSGGTPSKHNPLFWVGDVPFVSARDLKSDRIETALLHISCEAVEQSATKLAPVGSLLMLVRGMGLANGIQIGEVTAPVAFNQDIRALHPPLDSVLPRFLLLSLRNSFMNGEGERVLSSAAHGTLKIDTDVLRQIAISLPPLPEQKRIVGVLDDAFEAIATAKANAEKNLQNARALFESHLQSAFTQGGTDWVEKPLAELCESSRIITYGVIKLGDEVSDGVPCLRTSNVRWLRIDTDGMKRIAPSLSAEYARTILKGGEILVNVRGTLGGVSVASAEMAGWNVSREVAVVPVDSSKINPSYLAYWIGAGVSQHWLGGVKKGAAYVGINIEDLRMLPVRAPKMAQQLALVRSIETFQSESQRLVTLYQRKLAALEALKKSLLHQAFTGQLTSRRTNDVTSHAL